MDELANLYDDALQAKVAAKAKEIDRRARRITQDFQEVTVKNSLAL